MIEIRPHTGYCRGELIDSGLDGIWEVNAMFPKGRRIGLAGRARGAPLQLTEDVPASLIAEAQQALDNRDFGDLDETKQAIASGQREVQLPPAVEDLGEDEDE